jgi:hypothetical protein
MTTIDLTSIAQEVSTVDEAVMKALPIITTITGIIPGAQVATPFLAMAGPLLQAIDNAAKDIADSKPGAAWQDILQELTNHVTKGQPNSPILSG